MTVFENAANEMAIRINSYQDEKLCEFLNYYGISFSDAISHMTRESTENGSKLYYDGVLVIEFKTKIGQITPNANGEYKTSFIVYDNVDEVYKRENFKI